MEFLAEHEADIPISNFEASMPNYDDEEQAMLATFSQGMNVTVESELRPLAQELQHFRKGPAIYNVDVLAYWKAHEKEFPLLAQVTQ